jgi:KTSC domain
MPAPRMHPVDSSAIARIGYDAETGKACVEFHDSSVYAYGGVPPSVFEEFARADSKGTFLNTVIKPRYPARKIS